MHITLPNGRLLVIVDPRRVISDKDYAEEVMGAHRDKLDCSAALRP